MYSSTGNIIYMHTLLFFLFTFSDKLKLVVVPISVGHEVKTWTVTGYNHSKTIS